MQLAAALATANLTSAHGPWSRTVEYRHLLGPPPGLTGPPQPLWGGAAKIAGARFTPQGAFDSIYLSHHPITRLDAGSCAFALGCASKSSPK